MANQQSSSSSTYRTALEVAVISLIIYVLLGTPGLSSSSTSTNTSSQDKTSSIQDPSKSLAKPENLVYPSKNISCPRHAYKSHIYSTRPLVVYVDGFLSDAESEHLIALSESKWKISTIVNAGVEGVDDKIRKSEKAAIERDQKVQCIEARALEFQGWPDQTFIERLWTQRYNVSGHYSMHYDWASSTRTARRVSSFMVYLQDTCVGGGTYFPRLPSPKDERWCEFVECLTPGEGDGGGGGAGGGKRAGGGEAGVTFRPEKGSAVFWMNVDDEGRGYKETIHAGMPVTEGQKVGLNIWSWYQAGHRVPEEEGGIEE